MKNIFLRTRYWSFLQGFSFAPVIKVLTGLRRVGKRSLLLTYLQWQKKENNIAQENIFYINKEDFTYEHIKTANNLFEAFNSWKNISNGEECLGFFIYQKMMNLFSPIFRVFIQPFC